MAAPSRKVVASRVAVSVIVPALNEERSIAGLLGDLRELEVPHEVIVVDGGSTDRTATVAARHGARVLRARRGRGAQLAAGARAATAPVLCFLHADVRLRADARRELAELARTRRAGAFAFRFRIDARGWRYRLIEFGARLRVWLFELPYGDQGLVVSRADYEAAGGYADLPLMEDVAEAATVPVFASGGVASVQDIRALAHRGVAGVIVGMALYTGVLDARAVLNEFDQES